MTNKYLRGKKPKSSDKNKNNSNIYIFTEGDVTEPEYFAAFLKKKKSKYDFNFRVSVNRDVLSGDKNNIYIIKSNSASDPINVFERALYFITNKKTDYDIVFIVIDADNRYRQSDKKKANLNDIFNRSVFLCKLDKTDNGLFKQLDDKKVYLIYSNVAFEFWLLLHLQYTTADEYDFYSLCDKLNDNLMKEFKGKLTYSKNRDKVDFSDFVEDKYIDIAKDNASKVFNYMSSVSEVNMETNPITNVHVLIQYLEAFLDNKVEKIS